MRFNKIVTKRPQNSLLTADYKFIIYRFPTRKLVDNREQERERGREHKKEQDERASNKKCSAHKKYTESQFNVLCSFKTTGDNQKHFSEK